MVQLFLSEPIWSWDEDDDSVQKRTSILNELESIICSLIASGSRSEARLWLCKSISNICSLSSRSQHELFSSLLESGPRKKALAAQLLRMIFEKEPQKAGPVVAMKSHMLEDFFRGNSRRALSWFSNFSGSGYVDHAKGAKALAQFAFVNRDICWEELCWKGKHGQSPAMVATKPHYFLDLDVEETIENFLENVPEFWSSNEFSESLKDGDIISIDMKFFIDMFIRLMYKEDLKEAWQLIDDFLMEEPFASLCNGLLIILDERELCAFIGLVRKYISPKIDPTGFNRPFYCFEIILQKCSGYDSFDDLLLLNAVISQGRQLLRLVHEEEHRDLELKVKDIVQRISSSSSHANGLIPLMKRCLKTKTIKSVTLLGLQSWALHYMLSDRCRTPETLESLFTSNGISFRQCGRYALLHSHGFSEGSDSDMDGRDVKHKRKKIQKQKRKRSRNLDHNDGYDYELLDFNFSHDRVDIESRASSWLISTDDYSTSWSSADLPEYLSNHCFSTWMRWVFAKWEGA